MAMLDHEREKTDPFHDQNFSPQDELMAMLDHEREKADPFHDRKQGKEAGDPTAVQRQAVYHGRASLIDDPMLKDMFYAGEGMISPRMVQRNVWNAAPPISDRMAAM